MAATTKSGLGVIGEVARLKTMTAVSLRKRYDELCPGQEPRSNNHSYLLKKIAAKLQEQPGLEKGDAAGSVSLDGRSPHWDPRLPAPGAILTKKYKDRDLKVLVAKDGFEFEGTRYRSLSAIARKVTGTPWNGFLFFNLIPSGKAS